MTFRRVTRTGEYPDGKVWLIYTGSVVPEVMPRDTPVLVRVRRRR